MTKIFRNILFTFFPLIIISCSAGKSVSEYLPYLSNETAQSRSTDLKVRIPKGWYTALDNENNIIDIWLIKEDQSAAINIIKIKPDEASVKEAGGSLLEAAVKFSRTFKKASADYVFEFAGGDEYTTIGSNRFGIYKYKSKTGALVRVALVIYKEKIYEITALPMPPKAAKLYSYEELYSVQDAILSSIE